MIRQLHSKLPRAGPVVDRSKGFRPKTTYLDDPIRLLKDVKAHRVDPTTLSQAQRRACVAVLADGTMTRAQLGSLFGVAKATIGDDLREIRLELGREVGSWTVEEAVGHLALAAEKWSAEAVALRDFGLAWTIRRDFLRTLKELGVLGPRDADRGIRITVEALGAGYDRAREVIGRAMDPRLSGEVVEPLDEVPPLPLPRGLPDPAPSDPPLELSLEDPQDR